MGSVVPLSAYRRANAVDRPPRPAAAQIVILPVVQVVRAEPAPAAAEPRQEPGAAQG